MSPIVRQYYRVPRQNRATYIHPAPADLPALVQANRRLIASYGFRLAGRPFQAFRAAARTEVVGLARAYTARWGFATPEWADPAPLVFTGHQPQPFHTGVWIKNFLAGHLASAVGGAAVNMIVDNDEVHAQAFRFPDVGAEAVRTAEVPFAPAGGGMPFEEQPASAIRPEAVHEVLRRLPAQCAGPLRRCWQYLCEAVPEAASVGEAVSFVRRRLEEEQGLANLEIPVSAIADSEAFRLFLSETLARHEDLFAAYNASLAEYRRVYHERSPAQPVPDLALDGPHMELPFWVWRDGKRRRLWIDRHADGGVFVEADREPVGLLHREELADASAVAARLAEFRRAGWKIRPRALSLTLFVHLCLGEVFVHGLGGALYDKVTEAVFERFFSVQPPGLILASCTVHLPLETYPAAPADLAAALRAVRDWRFNPDRMMAGERLGGPQARALADEKHRLIGQRAPTRDGRRGAFHRIHEINAHLAALEPEGPPAAEADLARVRRELRANAVLTNREYPFWLYQAEDLAAFYRQAATVSPHKNRG